MSTGPPLSALLDQGDPDELFELIDEIAQGSYGHVFNAIYLPTKEPCALKIIALEEDETFDDLKVEIALLKACSHDKIVKYIGSWQKGEELFIAMELCDGASIDRILEARGAGLTEPELAMIAKDSLEGLDYLHSQHTLHRDIKSANLLVNTKGDCKLVDFGVSVISQPGVKRMTFIGSPYWMAPEVIDNRTLPSPYGALCDVWSMGVTLIEMAENCVPLSDLQPMVALRQIPSRPPPELKEKDKWSAEFIDFLNKCLQKDPDDRQSCAELLQHPWITGNATNRAVLVDLAAEYLRLEGSDDETDEEDEEDIEIPATPPVAAVGGLPEMPPVPQGQQVVSPISVPPAGSSMIGSHKMASPRRTPQDIDSVASKVAKRTDVDKDDQAMLLQNLEEAKKKNRPTSLRRSSVEQDKFVAQVRNQQLLKEQLKEAKKRQQKHEVETKKLQKQQDSEIQNLEKEYKANTSKHRKADTTHIKGAATKGNAAVDKMRKHHAEATKTYAKVFAAEQKSTEKSFDSVRNTAGKQLKAITSKANSTLKSQCKNQLKDKGVKKKQSQALHKVQLKELGQTEAALEKQLGALLDTQWADVQFAQAMFQEQRTTSLKMSHIRLSNLRELHNLQRAALLELHVVMDGQASALEHNTKLSAMELEHLAALHDLRLTQVQKTNASEFDDHKKSAEVEHKRLMRDFRLGLKKEAKQLAKLSKNLLKKAKAGGKARVKAEMEAKKQSMAGAHAEKESQFEAHIANQVESDLQQLVDYHKDQVERLQDFQTRELAKAQKAQERRLANLADQQALVRSDQEQQAACDAFRFYLDLMRTEVEHLKASQAQELKVTTKDFAKGGATRVDQGELTRQVIEDMNARHAKILLEFEREQKETFAHAFSLKEDPLLEQIWAIRGSGDLDSALVAIIEKPDVPMVTSEQQRLDSRNAFEAEQTQFSEAQQNHYNQIGQQLTNAQGMQISTLLEECGTKTQEFMISSSQQLDKLVTSFGAQFEDLK